MGGEHVVALAVTRSLAPVSSSTRLQIRFVLLFKISSERYSEENANASADELLIRKTRPSVSESPPTRASNQGKDNVIPSRRWFAPDLLTPGFIYHLFEELNCPSDTASITTIDPEQRRNDLPEPTLPPPPKLGPPTPPKFPAAELIVEELPFKEMNEPRYHTTTTVVETTEYLADSGPTVQLVMPKMDCGYVRTLGGIVKIVCIALCLLTFLFVLAGPAYFRGAGWATFVASVGVFVTTSLLMLYIFHVVDTLNNVNWIVIEMVFCFVWTICFFIAGCVLAVASAQFSGTFWWAVASFFAFGGMCAYGFDCYLKFLSWKNDEKATGGSNDFVVESPRRRTNV
ncbi:unnamed protein product [Caenorhabditis auriculariae]|uniref:MARVEL domain-containing protein n=1 Tax=Caenorhabditis auriculariae TaxID=2777116 RepID=A0A8S1GM91_9PELO|nr:unnamed protein product [Caenorhabditis auriculariae]